MAASDGGSDAERKIIGVVVDVVVVVRKAMNRKYLFQLYFALFSGFCVFAFESGSSSSSSISECLKIAKKSKSPDVLFMHATSNEQRTTKTVEMEEERKNKINITARYTAMHTLYTLKLNRRIDFTFHFTLRDRFSFSIAT